MSEHEKTALITGITGQDGSYLAELLLSKGYIVHGIVRAASNFNTQRIDHLYEDRHVEGAKLKLHHGDLLDGASLRRILTEAKPDEVYNLAAQSHVAISFRQPMYSVQVGVMGTLALLEAIRDYQDASGKVVRMYQASSSEMYGDSPPRQSESTPFRPRSPYACAKVYAFHQCVNYREAYGMFIANGIMFNHESPRRGERFVTRKISRALTRIKLGLQDKLYLGNLSAQRDWGYARDYVRAMWMMLQVDEPDDYVVATGQMHSVQECLDTMAIWAGVSNRRCVVHDPFFNRPSEVDALCGCASKAQHKLDWVPTVRFGELCKMMVDTDMKLAREELAIRGGFWTPACNPGPVAVIRNETIQI
ncbi:MAG: GDP-mannose 4,6-dehydratase [Phycisphaerae bacterium]|nr:GDP-mannose 4,6-dehydratase [Phycisphaerae bacterium]